MKAAVAALALLWLPCSARSQTRTEPLRLDAQNPHVFRYRGRAMVLITSGEHYGSVINPDFDYKTYLATLQGDGLNLTRLFGGSYVEAPGISFGIQRNTLAPAPGKLILPWARSAQPGYAGGGNKFDLDSWDAEYFRRLHDFLSEAERRGVMVEISLFSSQYGEPQWKMSAFNPENNVNHTDTADRKTVNTLENGNVLAWQERYVRKMVRETNAHPNVIFELQNEPWSDHGVLADVVNPYLPAPARDQYPNSIEVADDASIAWQTRVEQWIASEEAGLPNKHLIAQNYTNFRLPVRGLIPGISIVNFHYAYPEAVTLNYGLGKAIAYDETGFLGRGDDAYLRQAWNFMLAGGSSFDALDYSFTPGHADGTDTEPNGPGGGSPALRRRLGILAKLLARLPWANMAPDSTAVVHAEGVIAHAMSSPGGVYALYLDGRGPCAVTLKLPTGRYRGVWVDVETGKETPLEISASDGAARVVESPAFSHGIALTVAREVH